MQKAAVNSKVAEAKADVADAADHIKSIVDIMVSDIMARQEENQEALDAWLIQMKSEIDTQAQANIDNLSQWIN